jgi:D-3-phosphoglycerate dehydrogenase
VAKQDVRVLELSALKGIFGVLVDDPISYVNAPVFAKNRGIEVALTAGTDSPDHRSMVRVRTTLTDGQTVSVAGTVAGPRHTKKLVQVDRFDLDVAISDHMAFLGYIDRPGVVGAMGRLLGEQGVNIAGMQVGRTDAGGDALTVLTVDSAIPATTMEEIVSVIGAGFGRAVDLA